MPPLRLPPVAGRGPQSPRTAVIITAGTGVFRPSAAGRPPASWLPVPVPGGRPAAAR